MRKMCFKSRGQSSKYLLFDQGPPVTVGLEDSKVASGKSLMDVWSLSVAGS